MTEKKKSKIAERLDAQSFGLGYRDAEKMERENLERVRREYELTKKNTEKTKELLEKMKSFAKAKRKLKRRNG